MGYWVKQYFPKSMFTQNFRNGRLLENKDFVYAIS